MNLAETKRDKVLGPLLEQVVKVQEEVEDILNGVLGEITSRSGLEDAWDSIDGDIQEEIKDKLRDIIWKVVIRTNES